MCNTPFVLDEVDDYLLINCDGVVHDGEEIRETMVQGVKPISHECNEFLEGQLCCILARFVDFLRRESAFGENELHVVEEWAQRPSEN